MNFQKGHTSLSRLIFQLEPLQVYLLLRISIRELSKRNAIDNRKHFDVLILLNIWPPLYMWQHECLLLNVTTDLLAVTRTL